LIAFPRSSFGSRLAWVLIVVVLQLGAAASPAPPRPSSIRVVMDDNYPPFVFLDSGSRPEGILVDQWRLWEQKTGIKVDIHAVDWADALRGMRARVFDVIGTAFLTEERTGFLAFSAPYQRIEVAIFFDREIAGIADAESLHWLIPAAGGIVLILSFLAMWNRTLQGRVRQRTAELMASEERFQSIFHSVNDAVFIHDCETGAIVDVNERMCAMYGCSRAEALGAPAEALCSGVAPSDRASALAWLSKAAAGQPQTFPWHCRRRDGTLFWGEVSMRRARIGPVDRIVATVRDVTDRKQDQEARRSGEMQLRYVLEAADCLLWQARVVQSASGEFDWRLYIPASSLYRRLFGSDPGEPPLLDWMPLKVPEGDAMHANYFRALTSGASGYEQEFHAVVNGGAIWLREQVSIAPAQSREWILVGVITDITKRKAIEATLRESENRLVGIIDSVMDAIITTDETGRIVVFNRAAEEVFRCSAREVIGQSGERFIPEKLRAAHREHLRRFTQIDEGGQAIRAVSGSALRANGEEFPIEASVSSTEVDGRRLLTVILRDVTERVRAETARKALEEQVLLTQRLESVGRLAGGIAHDLNNILTPILLGTPLLREVITSAEANETLTAMEISAKRGADIIGQLLAFSRGGGGQRAPVQLTLIVRDMCAIIRETFPKNITTRTDFPPRVWMVTGNSTQLHQVLMNLCVNARDAMSAGGNLSIVLENVELDEEFAARTPGTTPGPHVLLSVTDTGMGIPPEILGKIFDPFFTTKDFGRGTGLGLSTVLGIAKSHGGIVQVTSRIGEGTQFRVYLPAVSGSVVPADSQLTAVPVGKGELILVVDDEVAVRSITRKILERYHYRVVEAADGREALACFVQNRESIAVVITDLLMPVVDGPSFIRELRRFNPTVPVIAASGYTDGVVFSPEEKEQVQAILAKPYAAAELLICLHELLHSGEGTSSGSASI
jgi:PAS domain S-box-containing protein